MQDAKRSSRESLEVLPHVTNAWDAEGNPLCNPDCPRCYALSFAAAVLREYAEGLDVRATDEKVELADMPHNSFGEGMTIGAIATFRECATEACVLAEKLREPLTTQPSICGQTGTLPASYHEP